jgi:hypothetical protein
MKMVTASMILATSLAALQLHGQPQGPNATNRLAGTWTYVESVHTNPQKTTDHRPQLERMFAVISDTHSIYGMIDPETMLLKKVNFGCSYTLEGSKWTEQWDFGANAGKKFIFELRFEGDKMYKTSADGKNGQLTQVWERFKRPAQTAAEKEGASVGQQLMDLKKAKDAGAITDEEYQAQKAKLLRSK